MMSQISTSETFFISLSRAEPSLTSLGNLVDMTTGDWQRLSTSSIQFHLLKFNFNRFKQWRNLYCLCQGETITFLKQFTSQVIGPAVLHHLVPDLILQIPLGVSSIRSSFQTRHKLFHSLIILHHLSWRVGRGVPRALQHPLAAGRSTAPPACKKTKVIFSCDWAAL